MKDDAYQFYSVNHGELWPFDRPRCEGRATLQKGGLVQASGGLCSDGAASRPEAETCALLLPI